jgi:hypothetical protein
MARVDVQQHLPAVEVARPCRMRGCDCDGTVLSRCNCGWTGPNRYDRVTAEDDGAGHLLDVIR